MTDTPAFPVRTSAEPGGARAVLSDLPYVAVPLSRALRRDGRQAPQLLLLGGGVLLLWVGVFVLIVAVINWQSMKRIIVVSATPLLLGLAMLRVYFRRKRVVEVEPHALVVPARPTSIPRALAKFASVPMKVRLYGREKETRVPVPREFLASLTTDSWTYLMAVPRGLVAKCHFDAELSGQAVRDALAEAEVSLVPVAQRVGDVPPRQEDGPFHVKLAFTEAEHNEAHFAAGAAVPIGSLKPRSALSAEVAILGWLFFLCILPLTALVPGLNLRFPAFTAIQWTGLAVVLASCVTCVAGWVGVKRGGRIRDGGPVDCRLDESRINWSDALVETSQDLADMERWMETPRLFVLQQDRQYFAIPKRGLADEAEVRRLRRFLERRVNRVGGLQ